MATGRSATPAPGTGVVPSRPVLNSALPLRVGRYLGRLDKGTLCKARPSPATGPTPASHNVALSYGRQKRTARAVTPPAKARPRGCRPARIQPPS
jgi:hypothetical protein